MADIKTNDDMTNAKAIAEAIRRVADSIERDPVRDEEMARSYQTSVDRPDIFGAAFIIAIQIHKS